jgi:putative protease
MALKRKAKAKAKPKRRKAPAKRPAVRGKTALRARKTVRKAPARRPAPKAKAKARRAPRAAKPQLPGAPARPAPGERIGIVTHYYGEPRVAIVKLDEGARLRVGDTIHILGHTSDFTQRVDSLQIEHAAVEEVGAEDDFGLKVVEHAREHDVVYRLK